MFKQLVKSISDIRDCLVNKYSHQIVMFYKCSLTISFIAVAACLEQLKEIATQVFNKSFFVYFLFWFFMAGIGFCIKISWSINGSNQVDIIIGSLWRYFFYPFAMLVSTMVLLGLSVRYSVDIFILVLFPTMIFIVYMTIERFNRK